VIREENLREQIFVLTYAMRGVNYDNALEMEPDERVWFLNRLHSQKRRENEEIEKKNPRKR
jgi:hypothetical protein